MGEKITGSARIAMARRVCDRLLEANAPACLCGCDAGSHAVEGEIENGVVSVSMPGHEGLSNCPYTKYEAVGAFRNFLDDMGLFMKGR